MKTTFELVCQEFKVTDPNAPYTHTLLTGGKYNFSYDLLQSGQNTSYIQKQYFIECYSKTYGHPPTVAEFAYSVLLWWWQRRKQPREGLSLIARRSDPYFFMYFDIDIRYASWDIAMWIQQQRAISSIVHSTVSGFFEDGEHTNMTVACTDNIRKIQHPSDTTKELTKVGIHLYFPNLIVSFEESMILLHAVTIRVRDVLGERHLEKGENSWSDVFDSCVYRNGLRECLTFKTIPCEKCNNWANHDFDTNSLYVPKFIIESGEFTEITPTLSTERKYTFAEFDVSLYNLTRIRCSSQHVASKSYTFCNRYPSGIGYIPSTDDLCSMSSSGNTNTIANTNALRLSRTDENPLQYPLDLAGQRRFRNFTILHFDPIDLQRIERSVRENFDESRYGSVQIRNVYAFFWRDKDHTINVLEKPCRFSKIKITLKGPGSRYCFNKGGEHKSNTAYFEVTVKNPSRLPRLEQRCWSPHSYRSHGQVRVCERFRSGQIKLHGPLSKHVVEILFHHPNGQPQLHQSP